jgi:hypothetical protein
MLVPEAIAEFLTRLANTISYSEIDALSKANLDSTTTETYMIAELMNIKAMSMQLSVLDNTAPASKLGLFALMDRQSESDRTKRASSHVDTKCNDKKQKRIY